MIFISEMYLLIVCYSYIFVTPLIRFILQILRKILFTMSSRVSDTLRKVAEATAALLAEMPEGRRLSRMTGTTPHIVHIHVPTHFQPWM